MSKAALSSALRITAFDLRYNRRQIIGWCAAVFAIMFMYMILFPSMQDIAKVKMEAMPEEFLRFFGMERMSDMSNFIAYFGMVFNLILVAASIFAATFSANLIYKEEKLKTIEFLYSLEVSRSEIYFSKVIAALVSVLAVLLSSAAAAGICGFINGGETFAPADFLQIVKISGFTVVFFMALSLMLAGITAKIGVPAVGSMAVLFCYVVGYLSELLGSKGKWLSYLSPFELLGPDNAVELKSDTVWGLCVYFVLSVLFVLIGARVYRRRDFNI